MLLDPDAVRLIVTEKNAVVFTFVGLGNPLRQVEVFLTEDLAYERLNEDADSGGEPAGARRTCGRTIGT